MKTPLLLIATLVVLAVIYNVLLFGFDAYRRFHNCKIVTCPDDHSLAEVRLRTVWALVTGIIGKSQLRVKNCTRWPRKKGCAENCVKDNWPAD
jgi:hypothetical protein